MVIIEDCCFSIPQICESGQCFRLDACSEDTYELLAGERYLKIQVIEDTQERRKTALHCTEEEYEQFWKYYFDLDVSYPDISGK